MTDAIVTTGWLADHLDDPSVRIIEVAADTLGAVYLNGHIPGAQFRHWKTLCWHDTDRQLVTPAELGTRLGALGITEADTVGLYGDPVQFGAYALWSLTMAGHRNLSLLDGGRAKWAAESRPLIPAVAEIEPVAYRPGRADGSARIGRDDIRGNLGKPGRLLLDLRSPEEYAGERVMPPPGFDHGAERAGHIPGAVNLYYRELVNDDDSFKPADELGRLFAAAGATAETPEIVCYCRLSHRATLAWTAMTRILGFDNVKVYDGSWTEWGSIVGFPVER